MASRPTVGDNKTALREFLLEVFPETFTEGNNQSNKLSLRGSYASGSSYERMIQTLMDGGEWTKVWDEGEMMPDTGHWEDGDIFFIQRGGYSYFLRMIAVPFDDGSHRINTAYLVKEQGKNRVGNIDSHYLRDSPIRERAVEGIVNDYQVDGGNGKIWMYSPTHSSSAKALNYSLKGWLK